MTTYPNPPTSVPGPYVPPTPVRTSQAVSQPHRRTYRVAAGDTLAGLATRLYGNRRRWVEIYNANSDQITNPNKSLTAGQVLDIP